MLRSVADESDGGTASHFKDLALPHLKDIYTLARYLLRNISDADDAVQECYLRAFRHFDTFRGGQIKPWLMTILRNVCHDSYRSAAQLRRTTDYMLEKNTAVPIWREDNETPEQAMLKNDESETMQRLIGELPAEFREVIVLREINDLSYRDIAAVVEVPVGTVMSRLARGRRILRDAWIEAEGSRPIKGHSSVRLSQLKTRETAI
jgi:RNA polymerase sigma-70 factor (ECF subfamily)